MVSASESTRASTQNLSSDELSNAGDRKDGVITTYIPQDADVIKEKDADELLNFMETYGAEATSLDERQAKKTETKNLIYITTVTSVITLVLFMDKSTIGFTTILGIYKDTNVDKGRFNNLNSVFYGGYLAAQWPGHYLIQKLPLGLYLTVIVFLWALIVGCHAAAKSYSALMGLRFLLGAVEAVVVPAIEMTLGMFLTAKQREIVQPIYWASTALAPVLSSFISFGLLHVHTSIQPWRIFMAVNAGLSLFTAIFTYFLYPDNPGKAKYLSIDEKVHVIKSVQDSTKSSIEQKVFKRHQAIECLKDPVSWLFFFQAFTLMLSNSMTYQQNQLYVDIGVDTLGSSLVSAASGGFNIVVNLFAAVVIYFFPGQSGYIGAAFLVPDIIAAIGMVTIPWNKTVGLLATMILLNFKGVTYIVALGWTTSSCSGYTKKLYRNVLFMIAYGVANIISPQLWVPKDAPRYYPSWIVQIVVSFFLNILILLTTRYVLNKRNKERRAYIAEHGVDGAFGYVINHDEEGREIKEKVDVAMLDLTDFENKYFIYPL